MKAIETKYKGYRFRSRLEARWAVFFDALKIPYDYEKEGFDLGDAGAYLPDFYIPTRNIWIEIKPRGFILGDDDKTKYKVFASSGKCLGLFDGDPFDMFFDDIQKHYTWSNQDELYLWGVYILGFLDGKFAARLRDLEHFFEDRDLPPPSFDLLRGLMRTLKPACEMARSARFEHGELPTNPR